MALSTAALCALGQDRQLQVAPVMPAPEGQRRIALVIGNGAYKSAPLRNPVNDARAIAKALAETGFRVTVLENASQGGMRAAIRTFGDELTAGGVGLFYYAGHGMQVRGKNYLIPVNADIQREDEVEDQAVDANVVLAKMDTAKNALNLVILDACRNNPFMRSFRSAAVGLAQMDAPSGTLVAFATAPGSVASDGDGEHGLYTKHLLVAMRQPGLPIEQVFKDVRVGVSRDTGDRQVPWESSSLKGNFFFVAPDPSLSKEAQEQRLRKAVADAVKAEQQKFAEQRREMEVFVQQMLAKQKAELEEEMRRQRGDSPRVQAAAAVAPSPAVPPASGAAADPAPQQAPRPPTQVASIRPTPLAGSGIDDPRFPRVGDAWSYSMLDLSTKKRRIADYAVTAVSKEGIVETGGFADAPAAIRAHSAETYFSYEGMWHFSPYLLAFGTPKQGEPLRRLTPQRNHLRCIDPFQSCTFTGKVVGTEKVTVPAGTFEATKVLLELTMVRAQFGAWERREMTFWYATEARRLVKATMRWVQGGGVYGAASDPDYDFELVAYRPAEQKR